MHVDMSMTAIEMLDRLSQSFDRTYMLSNTHV